MVSILSLIANPVKDKRKEKTRMATCIQEATPVTETPRQTSEVRPLPTSADGSLHYSCSPPAGGLRKATPESQTLSLLSGPSSVTSIKVIYSGFTAEGIKGF